MDPEIVQRSRILIIDDVPENTVLFERILRQGGYQNFKSVSDARLALVAFTEYQPDLVAMDLRMPHVDGMSLMRQFRSRIASEDYVPILILTADLSRKAKQDALAMGAKDFLTKPLDLAEVLLRIYNLLETRWLHNRLLIYNHTLEERVRERTRALEEAQMEILQRLALASELRDDDTGRHTQRIGRLAAILGQAVGLSNEEVDLLYRAAPLHDVGKIGIPDAVLLKPGSLTPEERERVKEHTEIGRRLLSGSKFPILQMAERIALYHHERWDGKGYYGLKGEAIPLEARIVALVDAFDVITHARPYKTARSVSDAVAIIRQEKGHHFDPHLVDVFLSVGTMDDLTRLAEALEHEGVGVAPREGVTAEDLANEGMTNEISGRPN